MKELPIPNGVEETSDPDEIIRFWIGDGDSFVSLNNLFGSNYHVWGMMLADIASHAANLLEQSTGESKNEILQKIEDGYRGRFAEHLNVSGRILNPRH